MGDGVGPGRLRGIWLPFLVMETQEERSKSVAQAVTWCAVLLLANLIVGVLALLKLGEIADALN